MLRASLTRDGLTILESAARSLAEAVPEEPFDGVYTVDRTYAGARALRLDRHLDRLEDSARREGMPVRLDRNAVRAALRALLQRGGFDAARFRLSVARARPDELLFSLEPFTPMAPEALEHGVRCVSAPHRTRANPETKTLDWMHDRAADPLPPGIFEALLLGAGAVVLEGMSSNFYGVTEDRAAEDRITEDVDTGHRAGRPVPQEGAHRLHTAEHGVLAGVARGIVLEIAPDLLPVSFEPVRIAEVTTRNAEAFLTSSTRGVVPIVEIDGARVGTGVRGPWTRKIQDAYTAWVEAHLQPL